MHKFQTKTEYFRNGCLKKSLCYVNSRIFHGENQNEDRLLLENKIHQIRDCSWFFDHDTGNDWLEKEGTMLPEFLRLEDIKQQPGLESLKIDGCLTSNIMMILSEMRTFYSGLYSQQDKVSIAEINNFLESLENLPKALEDTTAMTLEITENEVTVAIKQLKIGKAPGSNSLMASFYKHYQDLLILILYQVFNDAFENKNLTISQYLAIVILLYKKGDQYILPNYHPISLTIQTIRSWHIS